MGYARYYYINEALSAEEFARFSQDVERIVAASRGTCGPEGSGPAVITPTKVALNGCGRNANEPLEFDFSNQFQSADLHKVRPKVPAGFGFVNTRGAAYDGVVAAALIALQVRGSPRKVEITGEHGDNAGEWDEGLRIYERAVGSRPDIVLKRSETA